jgi:hypothetical protein
LTQVKNPNAPAVKLEAEEDWAANCPNALPTPAQPIVLAGHSASASAGSTAGVSPHARTAHHMHSRPTCFANSDNRLVLLLKGRDWHSLCQ